MVALLIRSGKEKGKKLLFPEDRQVVMGRDPDCHIRLSSSDVSRKHCMLRTSAEGLFVSDLGSRNGTAVNGVTIREETHLKPGDLLTVGPHVFEVARETPPTEAGPQSEQESAAATEENILDWLGEESTPGETTISRRTAKPDTRGKTAPGKRRSHRYIFVKEVSQAAVVQLNTKRLSAHNYEQVTNELFALIDREGHKRIVLNLADVDYVYSTALVRLAEFDGKLKAAGGELRLCNVHPVLRELLEATQLHKQFDIRSDEQSALDAFW